MGIISNCTAASIKDAATSLINGNLVAFPTETVYGLGADACNERAVARIYEVKSRPSDHPLIVHISSTKLLDKWARCIPEYARTLAQYFWPGPMTLVLRRSSLASDLITGGQDTVAVRVPGHRATISILKEFESLGGQGVVAPSANKFGRVSPTTASAVIDAIGNKLNSSDIVIDGGQSAFGLESTIIDCQDISPKILRPGPISIADINSICEVKKQPYIIQIPLVRVSGGFKSHYKPCAQVIISENPQKGDGFIAFKSTPTPEGVIRLASPETSEEYARQLYEALRFADSLKLSRVCVVRAPIQGIGIAINDRLVKITA